MLRTVKEAARLLGVEPHQVYYLLAMGELEAVKIRDLWRLEPGEAEPYARQNAEKPGGAAPTAFLF